VNQTKLKIELQQEREAKRELVEALKKMCGGGFWTVGRTGLMDDIKQLINKHQ
jgi:hypothetical protein